MQKFFSFCCACVLALGLALSPASGNASPNSGFVIVEASGGIIATQYDQGGSVGYTYNSDKQECVIQVPCFAFSAGSGVAPSARNASGCTPVPNDAMVTECPSTGVTSVRIVIKNGGGVHTQNGDPGGRNGDCSPAHVMLVGSKPEPNQFAVYDGCPQAIYCATVVDTVEADAKDSIQGKCGYVQRH
jgi:hypothetical protein